LLGDTPSKSLGYGEITADHTPTPAFHWRVWTSPRFPDGLTKLLI